MQSTTSDPIAPAIAPRCLLDQAERLLLVARDLHDANVARFHALVAAEAYDLVPEARENLLRSASCLEEALYTAQIAAKVPASAAMEKHPLKAVG